MQPHFVCSECGFSSKLIRTCQNESCLKQGEPMQECLCEDGRHALILKNSAGEDGEAKENSENGENFDEESETKNSSSKFIDLDNEEQE